MKELSYRRHRFPPVVIQHAVWLYLLFTLSYRDVEDLLAWLELQDSLWQNPSAAIRAISERQVGPFHRIAFAVGVVRGVQ